MLDSPLFIILGAQQVLRQADWFLSKLSLEKIFLPLFELIDVS